MAVRKSGAEVGAKKGTVRTGVPHASGCRQEALAASRATAAREQSRRNCKLMQGVGQV